MMNEKTFKRWWFPTEDQKFPTMNQAQASSSVPRRRTLPNNEPKTLALDGRNKRWKPKQLLLVVVGLPVLVFVTDVRPKSAVVGQYWSVDGARCGQ